MFFVSKRHNVMLIGLYRLLKLTGKEKHAPYTAISLNKANLI